MAIDAPALRAPARFAAWLTANEHRDQTYGLVYRYHPRSDSHSVALCGFILDDLMRDSALLANHATQGKAAFGINLKFSGPAGQPPGKPKTLDLAIGRPSEGARLLGARGQINQVSALADLFLACEAKANMTEHGKSQPRIFDELSSSHEIAHAWDPRVIAAGVTVVNIAATFLSPLRQKVPGNVYVSKHRQPDVAAKMVQHLRGLRLRPQVGAPGFDAYCTIVVDCDNQGPASLWEAPPAPQRGEPDHYETFVTRIVAAYHARFAAI